MKKGWVLTQEVFDRLLYWLDADRDRAGKKYEEIRLRLIKLFVCRGCADPEELADETINRVAAKIVDVTSEWDNSDPGRYFGGVAQKIHLEYLRKGRTQQTDVEYVALSNRYEPTTEALNNLEAEYHCLEQCLERLTYANRSLVIRYYQNEKQAKIEERKLFAAELGIAVNALRIRAHRIRVALQDCVQKCIDKLPAH